MSEACISMRWEEYHARIWVRHHQLLHQLKRDFLEATELEKYLAIPQQATLSEELVNCGKSKCTKKHGPYTYLTWSERSHTRRKYLRESIRMRFGAVEWPGNELEDTFQDECSLNPLVIDLLSTLVGHNTLGEVQLEAHK